MDKDFEKYKDDHKNIMDEFYKSLDGFGSPSDDSFFKDLMGDSDLSAFGGLQQAQEDVDVSDLERKIAEAEKLAAEAEEAPAFEAPAPEPPPKSPFVPAPATAAAPDAPVTTAASSAQAAPEPEPSLPKWLPRDNWTPTMAPFVIRQDLRAYRFTLSTIAFMYGALDRSLGEPSEDQKLNSVKLLIDIILPQDAPPVIQKAVEATIDEVFRSAIEDHERNRNKFVQNEKSRQALFDHLYRMDVITYRVDECIISYAFAEILEDGSYGYMKFFNINGRNGSRLRLSDVIMDLEGLSFRIGEYLDYLPDNILSAVREEIMANTLDFSICSNGILIDGILIPVVKNSDIFNVDYFNSMKSGEKAMNIIMSDKDGHICWDFDCDGVLDDVDLRPVFTGPGAATISAVEVIRNGVITTFSGKDDPLISECVFARDEAPMSKVIIAENGSYLQVKAAAKDGDGYVVLVFRLDPDGAKLTDAKKVPDILQEAGNVLVVRDHTDLLGGLALRRFYQFGNGGKYESLTEVTSVMEGPFQAKIPFRARKLMYDRKTQGALETIPSGTKFFIEKYNESEQEFVFVAFGELSQERRSIVVKADQFVDPHAMIAGLGRPVVY